MIRLTLCYNFRRWVFLGLVLLVQMPFGIAASVRLGTQIHSASDAAEPRELSLVACVFDALDQPLHIQTMPWRRAQQDVKRESLEGFFMAIPDAEAARYATLSAPLMLENWYWFSLPQQATSRPLSERRTGVILGSHQERWLWERQMTPSLVGRSLPQLLKLLVAGRIEGVIADKEDFERVAKAMDLSPADYAYEFISYMPLAVYFGDHFLRQQPGFLPAFNREVYSCVKEPFFLSDNEEDSIRQLLQFVPQWLQQSQLQQALKAHNQQHTDFPLEEILQRDHQWRQALSGGDEQVLTDLVNAELTAHLQHWLSQHDFINEIIVTDKRGLNVAVLPWSSDYWQGDEEKFTAAIDADYGQYVFSGVEYDASTARFQLSASSPIYLPGELEPQGVFILGIDIHRAFYHALQKEF